MSSQYLSMLVIPYPAGDNRYRHSLTPIININMKHHTKLTTIMVMATGCYPHDHGHLGRSKFFLHQSLASGYATSLLRGGDSWLQTTPPKPLAPGPLWASLQASLPTAQPAPTIPATSEACQLQFKSTETFSSFPGPMPGRIQR